MAISVLSSPPVGGRAFSCNPNILKNADFYSAALLCRENKDRGNQTFYYDGTNNTAQMMPYWQYYGTSIQAFDDYIQITHDTNVTNTPDVYFSQFIYPDVVKNLLGKTLTASYLPDYVTLTNSDPESITFDVPTSIPQTNQKLANIYTRFNDINFEVYLRSDGYLVVQFHITGSGSISLRAVKLELGQQSTLCYLDKNSVWQLIDIHDKATTAERCGIRSYQDNMLDNPLFNINQRDISYGSGIAATSINYPCFRDRWRAYGASTYLYKYTDYQGVKVKHGKTSTTGIQQRVPSLEFVPSMAYTFSAFIKLEEEIDRGITADGLTNVILSFGDAVDSVTYSKQLTKQELRVGNISLVSFTFSVPQDITKDYFNVRIRNSNQNDEIIYSILAAKLEPGYISTLGNAYQLAHSDSLDNTDYTQQLRRCQRYLQVTYNNDPLIISQDVTLAGAYANTCYIFPARPSTVMAALPTITTLNADDPLFIIESIDSMNHSAVNISDIKRTWNRPCFSITGQSSSDVQRIVNADQSIFWSCEP